MATILREYLALSYDKNIVKESKENKQPIIVKALMQRADAPNQNNRLYPRKILEREIENYRKAISEGRATGECDHPESSIVSLQNVSHIVREIGWNGDDVVGSLEILDTPKGKIVQELMVAGVRIGISSRGVGEVVRNESGYDVVKEDFCLVAFDLVSEPSTQEAWLHENKQVTIDDIRKMIPKNDRIYRIVNEILKNR